MRRREAQIAEKRSLIALLCQKFLGLLQPFGCVLQIVVAVAKINQKFRKSNQVFDLKTQWTPAPFAHFLKFRPLIFGHSDIELPGFFCHALTLPNKNFELMANRD